MFTDAQTVQIKAVSRPWTSRPIEVTVTCVTCQTRTVGNRAEAMKAIYTHAGHSTFVDMYSPPN